MKKVIRPTENTWKELTYRPLLDNNDLIKIVETIFMEIKQKGDEALIKYTHFFDKVDIAKIEVSPEEITLSDENLDKKLIQSIQEAKNNIEKFHTSQREDVKIVETTKGVTCWRESRPIERVGIYIPGGTAPLFSSVLMLAIPAFLAGCKDIILCSPPGKDGKIHPAILYAAKITGVTRCFAVGGIQAIGGLSLGTESIPKVDKIFGPGNQYVTAAKQYAQNFGVAVDLPAGPSEVLVIADEYANAAFVAADLLSQAEHGADSQAVLCCTTETLAENICSEISKQLSVLPRKNIAEKALKNSSIIILDTIEECIRFSNEYAPEHLILNIQNYSKYSSLIENAGSVFLGPYSCESAGDYASGTNHTLPTNGYARNYSGVSLDSFVKKITFQEITKEGINNIGEAIEIMAEAEALLAHKNAVSVRLGKKIY
jgi:histidinol dehydrogenase